MKKVHGQSSDSRLFLLHVDMEFRVITATYHTFNTFLKHNAQRVKREMLTIKGERSTRVNVEHAITEKKSKSRFRNWKWKINFV